METAPAVPLDATPEVRAARQARDAARPEVLQARIRDLEGENQRLTLRVRDLQQQLWGRKAERGLAAEAAAGALSLFEDAVAAAPSAEGVGRAAGAPRRPPGARPDGPRSGPKPLDPRLPREVIALPDPPVSARRCLLTGAALVPGFTEQLEVLARRPAVYYVKRFERTVWVSPTKTAPVATPWPEDVLPRARMHVSVIAHVAAAHYAEHLPYYRLEQQLARTGVALARSTQVALMRQLDALVAPLVAHLKTAVLASGYVHLDATPVDVCDPQRPGRAREATLWAYRARSVDPAVEGLVWFEYQVSKSPAHPRAVLADYRGVLQTDGAAGLDALGPPEHVTHVGCWAHARRRFVQALRLGDSRAGPYLAQCDRLFRIDARARRLVATQPAHAARVTTWRARFSAPLAEALFVRAAADGLTLPPKPALGQAVAYLLAQRAPLTRCVTTPGARLDNNAVENAIRPVKLGAKNWLFVGHPEAGPRLANLFTLVENARQAGVDIEAYLTALLTHLPDHSVRRLGEWLPRAWQQRERAPASSPTP